MEKIQYASVLFRNRVFLLACISLNKVIGIIIRVHTFDNYKKMPRIVPRIPISRQTN